MTPVAGTTRDRRECIGRIGDTFFRLVDTAGVDGEKIDLAFGKKGQASMEGAMIRQTMEAARSSDLVLLMFDARLGVTSDLAETVRWLRKISHDAPTSADANSEADDSSDASSPAPREVVVLANKLEGDRWACMEDSVVLDSLAEISRVGFGEPVPISAEHGEGMADIATIINELTRKKRLRLGLPLESKEEGKTEDPSEKPLQLAILG